MKYCVKCGKELLDEAVLCTGCGCMTHDSDRLYKKQKVSSKTERPESGEFKTVHVFRFLINIFLVASVTLFIYATIYGYVYMRSNSYWGYFYLEYGTVTMALITSSISLILSIVGVSIHGKKTPTRRTELTFDFIIKIILSSALLSASICGICQ